MENRSKILEELSSLSPVLALLNDQNVFTVPADYFTELPDEVICSIKVNNLIKENPYIVPVNYFNLFAHSVIEKIKHNNESTDILPGNANTYFIPATYFDGFASSVLQKLKSKEYNSANEIFIELETIAPLLNQIEKANIYSVPPGYFDDFTANHYKEQSQIPPTAKVIPLGSRVKKWMYYAAAASVTAIIFFGGYSYFSTPKTIAPVLSAITFHQLETINVEQSIANLSEDDINNYLNNQAATTEISPVSFDADTDIQDFIDNASDEEIQRYLNENSDPGEKKS